MYAPSLRNLNPKYDVVYILQKKKQVMDLEMREQYSSKPCQTLPFVYVTQTTNIYEVFYGTLN
jgi:hypothetical protein